MRNFKFKIKMSIVEIKNFTILTIVFKKSKIIITIILMLIITVFTVEVYDIAKATSERKGYDSQGF